MLYAGIDLHKKHCQCYIEDEQGIELRSSRVESSIQKVLSFFDCLPGKVKIAVESCGINDNIVDALRDRGFEVFVSAPHRNRLIAESKVKTDRNDARILAQLLRANMLSLAYYPSKDIRYLRDVIRQRVYYVRKRTSCKNRVHRFLLQNGVHIPFGNPFTKFGINFLRTEEYPSSHFIRQLIATIEQDTNTIKAIEAEIKDIASKTEQIKKICTVYGIGAFNASVIWSEIGDLSRFKSHKNLVGMAGLHPCIHQSGESEFKGRIAKRGSPLLRWALVQSTHILIKKDSHITRFYLRILKRRGNKKAVIAAARKMLIAIYFMLKNNQPFFEFYSHSTTGVR